MTKARDFLGMKVKIVMDRPLGSRHPRHGFIYPVNYGYVPETISPDGEELDAYILGIDTPLKEFEGECIAVIHRTNDNDDKLVVAPFGIKLSDEDIRKQTDFQEQYFKSEIIMATKQSDIPQKLGDPALRALMNEKIHNLTQLTKWSEKDLLGLHGVGPKAISLLKLELRKQGLSFAKSK